MTGARLRNLRTQLRLSQEALAHMLGVSTSSIHRWETQSAAAGPLGVVRTVLLTLEFAVGKDTGFASLLEQWSERGQSFWLTKLFAFAGEDMFRSSRLQAIADTAAAFEDEHGALVLVGRAPEATCCCGHQERRHLSGFGACTVIGCGCGEYYFGVTGP